MVRAQWPALLYWPRAEFMYLVLTTSTGEAMMVVQKPAPKAEVKWQGRSSAKEEEQARGSGLLTPSFQKEKGYLKSWGLVLLETETPTATSPENLVTLPALPQSLCAKWELHSTWLQYGSERNSFYKPRGSRMKRRGFRAIRLPHLILSRGRVRPSIIYPNSPVMRLAFRRASLIRS